MIASLDDGVLDPQHLGQRRLQRHGSEARREREVGGLTARGPELV